MDYLSRYTLCSCEEQLRQPHRSAGRQGTGATGDQIREMREIYTAGVSWCVYALIHTVFPVF